MTLRNPVAQHRCGRKRVNGEPCQLWPMHGQKVCQLHGGKSPQALKKAEERMRDLVHPAISGLERLINSNDLGAMRYVLDYGGFKATEKIQSDGRQVIEVEYIGRAPVDVAHTNGHVLE